MERKQRVIANVKYQSPKGKGAGQLKGLLRYLQYRNDRGGHIPQEYGQERWVDHGLGGNFQTIAAHCEDWKSEHVQAFTLVINPNPDLIGLVPEDQREQFTRDLTETTMTQFLEARDLDIEWSYVLHRRNTQDALLAGRDNPHTHIILPGTYDSWADGVRLPFYMNRNKRENHIELLHTLAEDQVGNLMEHYVGQNWEQRYAALLAERQQPFETLRQSRTTFEDIAVPPPAGEPHGMITLSDGTEMQVWIGVQADLFSDLQAVGFICRWEEAIAGTRQAFIPKLSHISSQDADQISAYMLKILQDSPKNDIHTLIAFADHLAQSSTVSDPNTPEIAHPTLTFELER